MFFRHRPRGCLDRASDFILTALTGLQTIKQRCQKATARDRFSQAVDLPLDIRATAFQWRVWRQLQAIPYGETRTYQQVASSIGKPTATRAVARACATNPVALLIPCHRVVRTDGSMGGYRWGVDRKQKLLKQERERAQVIA